MTKTKFNSQKLEIYTTETPNYDMSNVLPDYDMSNVLPDYDMSNVLPDYDMSNVLPNYDMSNVLPDYDMSNVLVTSNSDSAKYVELKPDAPVVYVFSAFHETPPRCSCHSPVRHCS
jgi:hypothetical protein